MSIIPSGNNLLVQIKSDKQGSASLADTENTEAQTQAITPTLPILPTEAAEQDTAAATTLVPASKDQNQDPPETVPIEAALEKLNGFMASMKRDLEFSVDKESNQTVVTVRDTTTQEVVRQLPSEAALQLAKVLQDTDSLKDGALGQLLDVKT